MEKRFWVVLVVIVAVLAGVFVLTSPKDKGNADNFKSNGDLNTVQSYDHVRGSKENKVVLIEYGDFQCPACGAYFPIASEAYGRYNKVVTFVFRDFPLTQLHPNAFAAARAGAAASLQDKFWEMHDKLYGNQQIWAGNTRTAPKYFSEFAKEIGLDTDKFSQDYASTEVNDIINNFVADGTSQGVTATPTLILNGKKIENPSGKDTEAFFKQIESAIKDAGLKVPKTPSSTSAKS